MPWGLKEALQVSSCTNIHKNLNKSPPLYHFSKVTFSVHGSFLLDLGIITII
jgi:hypothetical protein